MSVVFDFNVLIPQFLPLIATVLIMFVVIALIKEFKKSL